MQKAMFHVPHMIVLPVNICLPSPSSPSSSSCVCTSTTTVESRVGGGALTNEDLRAAGSSEVRSTEDIEISGGVVRVQVGLKYLSCNAITAMKIAGGIRLTMRERRELIPYFLNPMLLNLYRNISMCIISFHLLHALDQRTYKSSESTVRSGVEL